MKNKSLFDGLSQMSEISMTPLMDLSFLLLTTFIITFPLMEQGIPVNLPNARADDLQSQKTSRTITINAEGKLYLDEHAVSAGDLSAAMVALGKTAPDTTVYLRSDENVRYREVVRVVEILVEANITKVALVTEGGEARPSK